MSSAGCLRSDAGQGCVLDGVITDCTIVAILQSSGAAGAIPAGLSSTTPGIGQFFTAIQMTVCDVLKALEDMNGKEVTVRGNWDIGDTGQILTPVTPCAVLTVRDGWVWADVIFLLPQDREAKQLSVRHSQILKPFRKAPGKRVRVVATVTGRLETRDHFEFDTLIGGRRQPRTPYLYFVAMLKYRAVSDLEAVEYTSEELERELEWRREPWAKPLNEKRR